jgi:hypothetical protein
LRSYLLVTPLYIIKTRLDEIWFWPIWTITDIRATHSYQNGSYQGTYLSIFFDGKLEQFQISPKSMYSSLLDELKKFDTTFRIAVKQNNIDYIINNDDFLNHTPKKTTHKKAVTKKLLTHIIVLLISLTSYGIIYKTNQTHPNKPIVQSKNNKIKFTRPKTAPNGSYWPKQAGYINGFEVMNQNGLSTVTIDNTQNDSDVFVKLISLNSQKPFPVRVFFIPAYGQYTLKNIQTGDYDIRYQDLDTGALSRSESFILSETPSYNGIQYSNITMTLYKIHDGNMNTYSISENEF